MKINGPIVSSKLPLKKSNNKKIRKYENSMGNFLTVNLVASERYSWAFMGGFHPILYFLSRLKLVANSDIFTKCQFIFLVWKYFY